MTRVFYFSKNTNVQRIPFKSRPTPYAYHRTCT